MRQFQFESIPTMELVELWIDNRNAIGSCFFGTQPNRKKSQTEPTRVEQYGTKTAVFDGNTVIFGLETVAVYGTPYYG
jgi:hypothetical protein